MSNDPPRAPEVTAELRLRPPRPQVTRLSRKVLIGLGGTAVIGIFGLGYWALQSGRSVQPQELYNTNSRNVADGLESLPQNYSELPHHAPALGRPLPGDLGPPILHAHEPVNAGENAAQQRLAQEEQAALTSGLFVQGAAQSVQVATNETPAATAPKTAASGGPSSDDPTSIENMQDQKLAFMNGPTDRETVSPDRLASPASPYIIQAGSIIPAALITGIRSDLPGQVTAQVTEDVFDSPTGKYLLIPQGAKLIGRYNSQVAFGQSRVQLVWTRLVMPNGQSIVLERQTGADAQGYAGLEDGVDYHWMALFKAALLSTVLGVGSELGANNNDNDIVLSLREGAADSLNQAGQQIVEHNLNIQPTLTIRPGFPVRVIVDHDLVLAPYRG